MDTKSKESVRRYKKALARKDSTSESSSSSNSDTGSSSSYSSSDSERKMSVSRRHRKKMVRSDDERRSKHEKRDHCQKKLEAKRDHLKRKLKEAKLRKRAAAAAAVLSGHSHRNSLSPSTQAKLKKLAERKHLREASKERREREKHRILCERERMRSRSPSKLKLRVHLEPFKQHIPKSPQRMHHQLMTREKIIIQTRGRDRTPSSERDRLARECSQRHSEHKLRTDDRRVRERAEREAARDKERAEALARCQERQRERERLAREKLRRQDENKKKYGDTLTGSGGDLNERTSDFNLMYHHNFGIRERSLDALERTRYNTKRDTEIYDHERNYLESDRFGALEAGEIRHDRDCSTIRRREESPLGDRFITRMRDMHDVYAEDGGERSYSRTFQAEAVPARHVRDRINYLRSRELRDPTRDYGNKDHEVYEKTEHERLLREHERKATVSNEWKSSWDKQRDPHEWSELPETSVDPITDHKEYNESFKRVVGNVNAVREHPDSSEPDWDVEEHKANKDSIAEMSIKKCASNGREIWPEKRKDVSGVNRVTDSIERSVWSNDWHTETDVSQSSLAVSQRSCPYRERSVGFRANPPTLMTTPVQVSRLYHNNSSTRLLNKRNMTYTNPNLIKKPQIALSVVKAAAQASVVAAATTAVAAAKAAAQSAANATTNPGILGHVRQTPLLIDKTELFEKIGNELLHVVENKLEEQPRNFSSAMELDKVSGELSEISDSDDELLSNIENKGKTEVLVNNVQNEAENAKKLVETRMQEEEDTLDFEEISDGEFEEESRFKNVADALGVDWASLIAESKQQASENNNMREIMSRSAKERWRTDNLLLNLGISLRMSGECFVKTLLEETQSILPKETLEVSELKPEQTMQEIISIKNENNRERQEGFSLKEILEQPLAFSQVCNRENSNMRNQLFMDLCDSSHHALSARQDLKLRRQLCGLPTDECTLPSPLPIINKSIKDLALGLFQSALEVK